MNAIILAGGRGTRLAPWHAPKCLIPINGVPILYRLLDHLRQSVDRIIVCTGYRGDDVAAAMDHAGLEDDQVWVAHTGEDVSMGTRILQAQRLLEGGRTLICYGDELADVDISKLVATHEGNWMTFTAYRAKVPGGTVLVDEHDNVSIHEGRESLVNIGFVVVEPKCWDMLKPEDGLSDWVNRVAEVTANPSADGLSVIVRRRAVGIYHHTGKRATVNSLADLSHAEEVWR